VDLAKIQEYAERTNLPSFTKYSISGINQLITDVFQTIQQGYVFAREDVTIGVAAIGSPIRDYSGKVVAAVSIAGLVGRFTDENLESIVHVVMKSAQQISIQMGFRTTV
jgi:DNA-binding IclR family transcriptional regulator